MSEDNESQGVLSIKDENNNNIQHIINLGITDFVTKIDFSDEQDFYDHTIPLELYDSQGKKIECDAMIIFQGSREDNPDRRKRQLALVIGPKNQLNAQRYRGDLSEFRIENEISIRYWRFLNYIDTNDLDITSNMKTNERFEGTGIGSSLLFSGETIMEMLARRLAEHFQVSTVESVISDGSDSGWTSRRMEEMSGYKPVKNDLGMTSYKRVLISPS